MEELTDISDRIIKDDSDINRINIIASIILIGNIIYILISIYFFYMAYTAMLFLESLSPEKIDFTQFYLFIIFASFILPTINIIASFFLRKKFLIGYVLYCLSTSAYLIEKIVSNSNFINDGYWLSTILLITPMIFIILLTVYGQRADLFFKGKKNSEVLDS